MHKVQRRTQIPFGPFLAAGSVIAVLFGCLDRARLDGLAGASVASGRADEPALLQSDTQVVRVGRGLGGGT